MSIQRVESRKCNTAGWQACAHVAPGERLTQLCSDSAHGGIDGAYGAALEVERRLQRQARVLIGKRAVRGRR